MIKVTGKKHSEAKEGQGAVAYSRRYTSHEGLECTQTRTVTVESDYPSVDTLYRMSKDNGRTWGEWIKKEKSSFQWEFGNDEMIGYPCGKVWNPVHKHYVATWFSRYFVDGHHEAYRTLWNDPKNKKCFDHQGIMIWKDGEEEPYANDLVKYEEGHDFDPKNPRDPEFLWNNNGFANSPIVLKNGDIAVPVGVPVYKGCAMAGLDVEKVFPSCPTIHRCVVVARGRFNTETERYDLTFSNPIILSDLRSSRGIDEPILAELESGRILLVMRGSNVARPQWNTRIEPGTPSFKWYAYSDDGGATFTTAEPWHFDDCEVIYSGATISNFMRSSKNGKLYWFGNVAPHTANGNWPRYPLHMAEVNETTGTLIKSTLTVIDTRREGETEYVQLSNFGIMEDRETLNFHLNLVKLGQYDRAKTYFCEGWEYEIDVDAKEE
ncbi:MAG: exo-alpha-sialidase [Clostridia bacterium]|nr:exo-alpha-sialidase [Clostridia bacterium]